MPCDGWECAEAYWTLVECAAAGVAVVFCPGPDGLGTGVHPVTPALAPVFLSPDPRLRVGGYIGFAIVANASLAAAREA